METSTVTNVSPVAGNVLFYTSPEPLSREMHGKMGVKQLAGPFGFAAQGHVVPLTVAEFQFAALSFPIIFAGDQRQPLAVLGINPGENLFVSPEGVFTNGVYIPAYIRRYPFVLAQDEAQQRMIVCIERGAALFDEKGGDVPLFDDKGEPSEYTTNAIKFCEDFEGERRRTENFVNLIKDLDLLDTKQATFTPTNPDGTPAPTVVIAEYFAVTEEKLAKLSPEKLVELRDNGALERIYNHMTSLAGWDRLVAVAAEKAAQTNNA
ncbi:MAG: peptidase [Caulobacter sp.]|nr:peptidase [Caulobacter sp.]